MASPVVATQPLQLCIAGGNTVVQGTLTGLYNSAHAARTVNTLPLEEYVADTVPGESPSSWATLGGPGPQGRDWGFQELEAQAVAVRSYVLLEPRQLRRLRRHLRPHLPDLPGSAVREPGQHGRRPGDRRPGDGLLERRDRHHRVLGLHRGVHLRADTSSPFTPVPDTGDGVCVPGACNPNHDWTATASASAIEAAWPQIGTFTGITNVVTDGGFDPAEHFGRVDRLTVAGTSGTVNTTGPGFAGGFSGCVSDFFEVASQNGGGATFDGHGWGHGIGMGQWGALGYAIGQDNGQGAWTYQQIVVPLLRPRHPRDPARRPDARRVRLLAWRR